MAAGKYNMEIEQGADFGRTMQIDEDDAALDITSYSFAGKIRENKADTSAMASFTIAITTPASGIIYVSLTNAITSGLTTGLAYYDIEMTRDDGTVVRLLEGVVNITREITR